MIRTLAVAGMIGLAAPAFAHTPTIAMSDTEQTAPALPPILPLKERAEIIDEILAERLDTIIPKIMREAGIDMWLLMSREYFEESVLATMLDAESFHARRRTILIFFDPGDRQPVERLTVSRYGLAGLFEPAWDPAEQPDQWQAVADIIDARDPAKIAINYLDATRFGDGMTLSQFRAMTAAPPLSLKTASSVARDWRCAGSKAAPRASWRSIPASSASPMR